MDARIDHINRYVSNVDKFVVFYQKVLGYELIGKGIKQNLKPYAILKGYGHELFVSEKEDFKDQKENIRHIGYSVDNIEALAKNLMEMGFLEHSCKIIEKKYSKQIYINDPDGFEIDLIQWTDKEGFYGDLTIFEK